METLFITLILTFVGYNVAAIISNGIPASLSDTYYDLPESWSKPFWFGMFVFWALSAMIIAGTGFMVFAGFGIALVGCAPLFKEKTYKATHFIGAGLAALMAQLHIFEMRFFSLNVASFILFLMIILFVRKNKTYWLEMVCFFSIFLALSNHI